VCYGIIFCEERHQNTKNEKEMLADFIDFLKALFCSFALAGYAMLYVPKYKCLILSKYESILQK